MRSGVYGSSSPGYLVRTVSGTGGLVGLGFVDMDTSPAIGQTPQLIVLRAEEMEGNFDGRRARSCTVV